MNTLQDLIKLTQDDGGKVFVVNSAGEVKLVILSVQDYEKLMMRKLDSVQAEAEKINQEIIQAQMQDAPPAASPVSDNSHIRHAIGQRARELFRSRPYPQAGSGYLERAPNGYPPERLRRAGPPEPASRRMTPSLDLRSEVIDPTFNFDASSPDAEDF